MIDTLFGHPNPGMEELNHQADDRGLNHTLPQEGLPDADLNNLHVDAVTPNLTEYPGSFGENVQDHFSPVLHPYDESLQSASHADAVEPQSISNQHTEGFSPPSDGINHDNVIDLSPHGVDDFSGADHNVLHDLHSMDEVHFGHDQAISSLATPHQSVGPDGLEKLKSLVINQNEHKLADEIQKAIDGNHSDINALLKKAESVLGRAAVGSISLSFVINLNSRRKRKE